MEWNRAIVTGDAVRRARAIAEFEEWEFVAAFHATRVAEIDRTDEMPLSKELARREVTLELAQALHVSENHIRALVSEAHTLRERVPAVWAAFHDGDIDAARASSIADTADRLHTRAAWTSLEQAAPAYAATHIITELRSWLRRLRARLEPDEVKIETARAIEQRRVAITHNDDGTSWLNALLPTGLAITIGGRLVLDPVGHVLDTTVLTYRPPESLRQALRWRDGTCRVTGCRAPTHETDLDHTHPYNAGGATTGSNLRCLCRKHHTMKSHGHLHDHHLDPPLSHL